MRRVPAIQTNRKIRRERDPRALPRLCLLLFSGVVLAAGFVFAAKQHFAAVQYGYNSEVLRTQRDQLVREQQQLFLERERVSSPARLEAAARALGLKPVVAGQVVTASLKGTNHSDEKSSTRSKSSSSEVR